MEIAIYIKNYIVTTLGLSRWFSGFTTEEAAAKIIVDLKLQRAFNPEGSHRIYETFNVPWWSCRSVRCCCAFTCRLAGNNQSTEGLELHYIVGWGGCLVGRLGSCMHTCLFCNPAKNLSGVHFGTRPSKLYNFWSFKGHTCKNRYFSDLHVAVNMCIFSYLLPPLVLSYLILSCFVSSILSHLTLSDLVFSEPICHIYLYAQHWWAFSNPNWRKGAKRHQFQDRVNISHTISVMIPYLVVYLCLKPTTYNQLLVNIHQGYDLFIFQEIHMLGLATRSNC